MSTFYALIVTQVLSLIGSRMTGIAVGIWVFAETGQTAPLLLAAFFAELPGMIGGSFTGLIADRWDRRYVMMLGDAGQAVGTILLLFSLLSGAFQLWHLYLAMLIQGVFGTLQTPASQAAITMLVPEQHRDRANGLKELGFPLAGIIAPLLTGILYGVVGLVGIITVDLLTFAVAVGVIYFLTIPRPPESEAGRAGQGSFWRELVGGWTFLLQHKPLLLLVSYISLIFFLINGPLEMAIPYLSFLTESETAVGVLLGAMNLGAFAGAATIAVLGRTQYRIRVILLGYLLLGVFFLFYGTLRQPVLLAITLFLLMFPLPLGGALFSSFLQTKTPPDMQGRVFAITGQLFMLVTPFSFLLTAALVDNVLEPAIQQPIWEQVAPLVGDAPGAGMGLLLVIVGLSIIALTLLIYALPAIRHLESTLPDYTPIDQSAAE